MATRQVFLSNEKFAQKKFLRGLKLASRFLAFIGKPFYFALVFLLIITLRLNNITGHTLRLKKIKKLFIGSIQRLNGFSWNTQVFFLAVQKLVLKLFISLLTSQRLVVLWTKLRPVLPAGRLKLVFIPLPSLPKISAAKFLAIFFSVLLLVGSGSGFLFWKYILKNLPSPNQLLTREQEVSTKIYDRNGVLLYKIYKDKNRSPLRLEKIPIHLQLATIAIEDAEFYDHPGFSVKGIIRAVIRNLKKKELTGGSTITQQLVKNTLLNSEKTLVRKLKEITLAVQVERVFSKHQILEMYLNEVPYGGTAYGIQEASRLYFNKDVESLTLSEAALLAGLPKSPTAYSPFGQNPEASFQRQKEVLSLMEVNGFITSDQRIRAEEEKIAFAQNKIDIKAPHFVTFVREVLEEKYSREVIEKGGLEVITSLDYQIQKLAEEIVSQEVEKLTKLNVGNASALVINPATGEILAMVGSKDYFDTTHDGNVNVTLRPRQPGSSIKVVTYAYALSNGHTLASILTDSPVTFNVEGQLPYTPKNYDGTFRGNLSLRSALAESRNTPAVKILNSYGVKNMLDLGKALGISTWKDPSGYGLSLTLGGGEVKLIDLAFVYATIANYGKKPEPISILKVTNYKSKLLEEFKCCNQPQILDPRVSYLLIDVLRDNYARSPAFGSNSLLVVPDHSEVAAKTGTSNDLRDNLTIGFNQKYLVAVWVGNNDASPMARIASGVTGATPIWNKIMSALLVHEENHDWQVPSGLIQVPICPYTGTLPCEGCPVKLEWFLEENKPEKACKPEWFKEKEAKPQEEPQDEILEPAWESEIIYLQQRFQRKKRPGTGRPR